MSLDFFRFVSNQSGFKPGDLRVSITHESYIPLNDGWEVRGVLLDISKAFDRVCHKGLIFKWKQNWISDDLLEIVSDFLGNRNQNVFLNGQNLSLTNVHTGALQVSILGPLLFLIFIDLTDNFSSNVKLFAYDTSLLSVIHNVNASGRELNDDLKMIIKLVFLRKMSFKQAQEVIFHGKIKKLLHPSLFFINNNVLQASFPKHLVVTLEVNVCGTPQ